MEQLRDILLQHIGKSNAISSKQVSRIMGYPMEDTQSESRGKILECAEKYKMPIAANNTGYYVIEAESELKNYIKDLEKRKKGIDKRIDLISNNFKEWKK